MEPNARSLGDTGRWCPSHVAVHPIVKMMLLEEVDNVTSCSMMLSLSTATQFATVTDCNRVLRTSYCRSSGSEANSRVGHTTAQLTSHSTHDLRSWLRPSSVPGKPN